MQWIFIVFLIFIFALGSEAEESFKPDPQSKSGTSRFVWGHMSSIPVWFDRESKLLVLDKFLKVQTVEEAKTACDKEKPSKFWKTTESFDVHWYLNRYRNIFAKHNSSWPFNCMFRSGGGETYECGNEGGFVACVSQKPVENSSIDLRYEKQPLVQRNLKLEFGCDGKKAIQFDKETKVEKSIAHQICAETPDIGGEGREWSILGEEKSTQTLWLKGGHEPSETSSPAGIASLKGKKLRIYRSKDLKYLFTELDSILNWDVVIEKQGLQFIDERGKVLLTLDPSL